MVRAKNPESFDKNFRYILRYFVFSILPHCTLLNGAHLLTRSRYRYSFTCGSVTHWWTFLAQNQFIYGINVVIGARTARSATSLMPYRTASISKFSLQLIQTKNHPTSAMKFCDKFLHNNFLIYTNFQLKFDPKHYTILTL